MDSNVLVALITGIFSVASALGAVFLKDYLDTRRLRSASLPHGAQQPEPLPEQVQPPQEPPAHRAVRRLRVRPALIVVGSFLFGMATRSLNLPGHYENLVALVLLIFTSVALSVYHRRKGFALLYQLEILALWTGWTSGWTLINGRVFGDLLGVTIPWWAGCAIVGGLIVSFRNPTRGTPRAG